MCKCLLATLLEHRVNLTHIDVSSVNVRYITILRSHSSWNVATGAVHDIYFLPGVA